MNAVAAPAESVEVEGPGWCAPGVSERTSRYPLVMLTVISATTRLGSFRACPRRTTMTCQPG